MAKNSGRQLSYCSFGIPFTFYSKAIVGPLESKSSMIQVNTADGREGSPGPGTYEAKSSLRNKSCVITGHNRLSSFIGMIEKHSKETPSPDLYEPKFTQT